MELRGYQTDAVAAIYQHLRTRDDNPLAVLPTGSGKTPVIATICRDTVTRWDGRVLVLAHVKELIEQAREKLLALAPELWNRTGVYSAGLRSRDTDHPVIIAGIQSVYRRACELGRFDLILIDEAHMVPAEDDGMYRQFIADARAVNPHTRIVGLTATPYRMKSGAICSPGGILNHVCYEVGVRELIVQGFLSPLRTKAGRAKADTAGLRIRAGEFAAGEVENLMDSGDLVDAACAEIVEYTKDRRATLVFASGVRHGRHVCDVLKSRYGIECGFVCGDTPDGVRAAILQRFRSGELRYLCNVNVLTTGFDAPHIDCVALVRPTMSAGLYYQMVGRGFRLHPGKADCLVLDFGGNVLRHGPVDAIRVEQPGAGKGEPPVKECPQCCALIAAGYAVCPQCGHVFPEPNRQQHEAKASSEAVLSDQAPAPAAPMREEHHVSETTYHVHYKRGDEDAPPTLRVEYRVGFNRYFREWVCLEHPAGGYARRKAEAWWRARSVEPVPASVEEAVQLADAGALAPTLTVTVEQKPGERYEQVVGCALGAKPPRLDDADATPEYAAGTTLGIPDEDIPF